MNRAKPFLIAAAALVLTLGLLTTARLWLNRRLDTYLRHDLEAKLLPDYHINFADATLDLLGNAFTVEELRLSRSRGDSTFLSFTAQRLRVHGFRPLAFLLYRRFAVDSITVNSPSLLAYRLPTPADSSRRHTSNSGTSDFSIGNITSTNGRLEYDPPGPEQLSCHFDFTINDIRYEDQLVNLEALWQKSALLIDSLHYMFADSVHLLDLDHIVLARGDTALTCSNLSYRSTLSHQAYPQHYGWCKSQFDINAATIRIPRPANLSDSLLILPQIAVDSLRFGIYKDARYDWPQRHTELPQVWMAGLPKEVQIDSITFTNSYLEYTGIFQQAAPMHLYFTDVHGALINFQNTDTTGRAFLFRAQASFMDRTPFATQIAYYYGDHQPFEVRAALGATRLGFMSDFLQKMAGLRIENGKASRLLLQMQGNTYSTRGYVDFYYDDLELLAVNKQSGEKEWLVNALTDLLSGLVFWKTNPIGEQFRRGHFEEPRVAYKGFASQWIDGLLEGLLHSVAKIEPGKMKLDLNTAKDKK